MAITLKSIKRTLYVLNIIFMLSGLALLILGFCSGSNVNEDSTLQNATYRIIFGYAIAILGLLGFWFTIKESMCLLFAYGVILLCTASIQLIFAMCIFINLQALETATAILLKNDFLNYEKDPNPVDLIQTNMKCCGLDGPKYWEDKSSFPGSCCVQQTECSRRSPDLFQNACDIILWDNIRCFVLLVGIMYISIGLLQGITAVMALYLRRAIVRDRSIGRVYDDS